MQSERRSVVFRVGAADPTATSLPVERRGLVQMGAATAISRASYRQVDGDLQP